jgi:hypothetical protein
MHTKTKFISFLLLVLLALPLVINPTRQGSVLGIQENTAQKPQINTQDSDSGKIGEGVMENKLKNNPQSNSTKGFAILDKKAKSSVTAKKFSLASEIQVQSGDKKSDLIVSNVDEGLADDVVLAVDENVFKNLGGNPETQDKILITIEKSN